MLLYSEFLKELPQPESGARTLLKGTEVDCGLNFKLNAFSTTESGLFFSSLASLCLCLSLFRCLSLSHTNTHYLAAKDSCSQLFSIQFIPPQPSFLLSCNIWLRSCSISGALVSQRFSRQLFFSLCSRWMLPASLFTMGHTRRLLFPLILL